MLPRRITSRKLEDRHRASGPRRSLGEVLDLPRIQPLVPELQLSASPPVPGRPREPDVTAEIASKTGSQRARAVFWT